MDKACIESAFIQFDTAYHDVKAVISAISWIASSEHDEFNAEALVILSGLSNLAGKMMEESLFTAGANQKQAAMDSLSVNAIVESRRIQSAEQSSTVTEGA